MPGPYRRCETHGWLEIEEYTVSATGGAIICPLCEMELVGRYEETQYRQRPGGPNHAPRDRFVEAARAYNEEHHR